MKLLYFASLREGLGVANEDVDLPVATVKDLMATLAARGGVWQEQFDGCKQIRAAVNQVLVADDAVVQAGDEVAFFPPVTGG
ncbi:MAG: molybdopterin converting factor subunit 1 [Methylophilaceae bacterium]